MLSELFWLRERGTRASCENGKSPFQNCLSFFAGCKYTREVKSELFSCFAGDGSWPHSSVEGCIMAEGPLARRGALLRVGPHACVSVCVRVRGRAPGPSRQPCLRRALAGPGGPWRALAGLGRSARRCGSFFFVFSRFFPALCWRCSGLRPGPPGPMGAGLRPRAPSLRPPAAGPAGCTGAAPEALTPERTPSP